jgi:D-beta-D-heptose 7-phosphate kinase / D-beta-D-heptose 1-phosphate adenosyltransferase
MRPIEDSMNSNDLLHVLETLGRPRILVLGDLILDRYTWGNAERVSQEAPVIVLRADCREARLGGAANVANMLAGLEAQVTCSGIVGHDASGVELVQLLTKGGVHCELVLEDPHRPTSVKERFVGRASTRHPSQILRVDHENCDPLGGELERQLIERIVSRMPDHDALLISDYGKGVCTPRLLKAAVEAALRSGVPVMVDPSRSCPLGDYRGVTVIKPNRLETELATGRKIVGAADALAAGRQLCQDLDAQMALITLDRDGMMLVQRDGSGKIFPTHARAVYDITGAGDMVLAVVGLCLADGVAAADAVRLGNVAAGLEVERAGVAVIYRDELRAELLSLRGGGPQKVVTREQAGLLALEHRRHGQKIVFTNGCFDLLHVGHVTYLTEAAALGDVLVVGVNSDASVRKLKGEGRPVIGQSDRAAMLAALACVHHVIVFDDDTPHALLHAIRPDVLVKGGTYTTDEVVGHEVVEAYGGTVCVTGVVDGISTTNILASLSRGVSGQSAEARPTREINQPVDSADDTPRLRRAG